jgi:maltooligosyltrehalose synthase
MGVMGVTKWWLDVGKRSASRCADFFDIDWSPRIPCCDKVRCSTRRPLR